MIRDRSVEAAYDFLDILGEGGFATVVKAKHLVSGELRAIKIVDKQKAASAKDSRVLERVHNEVDLMRKCHHPNILRLIESYESDTDISLVLPLMNGGELWDRIFQAGHFQEQEAVRVLRQMLAAVEYLHERNILHRDLKPENILCSAAEPGVYDVLIADFGLARWLASPRMEITTPCGTLDYGAPEKMPAVLDDGSQVPNPYGKSVDMWSVGCIAYFMLVGKPPFYAKSDAVTSEMVLRGKWQFPVAPELSEAARDFVSQLLELNPHRRMSAKRAIQHPWIAGPRPAPVLLSRPLTPTLSTPAAVTPRSEMEALKASLHAAIDLQQTHDPLELDLSQCSLLKNRKGRAAVPALPAEKP